MKRLLALLVFMAAPVLAQQHLDLTNAPEPSDNSCDLAVFSTADDDIAFTVDNTNLCYETTNNRFEITTGQTFCFEGSTADAFETCITVADPTADRSITLPDATDTVVLLAETQTLTNKSIVATQIDSGTIPAARVGADHIDAASEISNIIGSAEMADEDHGDVSWTSSAATVENVQCTTCIDLTSEVSGEAPDANVADNITASSYLPLAGGTLTGELVADDLGVEFTAGDALTDCSTFSATGGGIFFDDSEGVHKKCEDNVLTDLDTGGAEVNDLEAQDPPNVESDELYIGTGSGTGAWVALSGDVVNTSGNVQVSDDSHDHTDKLPLAGGTMTGELVADELGIEFQETDGITDCSSFATTGGGLFYDDSEGVLKKCQDNVLTDLDTGGAETNSLETTITGIADTEIFVGNGADSGVFAAMTQDGALSNTGAFQISANVIDFADILFTNTLAGDPAMLSDECFWIRTTGGGGWICEGSTADTNEMLFLHPDLNEADTTHVLVTESATQTLTGKSIVATQIDSGTIPAARVGADHIDAASEIADNIIGSAEMDLTASFAWTGEHDFGGGGVEIENNTAVPGSCTVGQIFLDTDATSGQQLYGCEGGTFVLQGDGTGGGLTLSGVTDGNVLYDNSDALGGISQFTYDGTNLSLTPTSGDDIAAEEVVAEVWNDSGATIFKCSAVYLSGFNVPNDLATIAVADADDAVKMPAVGLVRADIANGAAGFLVTAGDLINSDTAVTESWSANDAVFVNASGTSTSDDCADSLTSTKPTGESSQIQKMGIVSRVNAANGELEITGAGRSNDLPNLDSAAIFVGTSGNAAAAVDMSGDVSISNTGVTTVADDSHAHVITNIDAFTVSELQTQTSDVTTFYTEDTVVPVADGGTGASTLTDGGILLGSGTSAITALGAAANGEIPIGDGTTDPVLGTITAVANETDVTNGAGSITIGIVTSPTLDGTNFSGIPSSAITTEVRSWPFNAGFFVSDGTQCADPTEVTVGSWGKQWAVICTDNDASTITVSFPSPDDWNAGTVTLRLHVIQDAASAGDLDGDVSGRCVGDGETPAAYGTEIAMDVTVTGTDAVDQVTSAAITLAGTCSAGDFIQLQYQIEAAGTDTAVATLNIIGGVIEYTSNIGS